MKNTIISAIALLVSSSFMESYAGQEEEIERLCKETMNMSVEMCRCVGGKSAELTEQERNFLIAMLMKDQATTDKMRSQMPTGSLLTSAMFMVHAPNNCAKELY